MKNRFFKVMNCLETHIWERFYLDRRDFSKFNEQTIMINQCQKGNNISNVRKSFQSTIIFWTFYNQVNVHIFPQCGNLTYFFATQVLCAIKFSDITVQCCNWQKFRETNIFSKEFTKHLISRIIFFRERIKLCKPEILFSRIFFVKSMEGF